MWAACFGAGSCECLVQQLGICWRVGLLRRLPMHPPLVGEAFSTQARQCGCRLLRQASGWQLLGPPGVDARGPWGSQSCASGRGSVGHATTCTAGENTQKPTLCSVAVLVLGPFSGAKRSGGGGCALHSTLRRIAVLAGRACRTHQGTRCWAQGCQVLASTSCSCCRFSLA